jgi:hypothetical protein
MNNISHELIKEIINRPLKNKNGKKLNPFSSQYPSFSFFFKKIKTGIPQIMQVTEMRIV